MHLGHYTQSTGMSVILHVGVNDQRRTSLAYMKRDLMELAEYVSEAGMNLTHCSILPSPRMTPQYKEKMINYIG